MKKLSLIFAALILLIIAMGLFSPQNRSSDQEISFLIERGEGTRAIAMHLEREGLELSQT